MVLGHEGVGVIEATGQDVKYMKKGDRVGWGYEHNSCEHCHQCLSGSENYCPERQFYGEADTDQGSFAHGAVWREAFLYPIPEGMKDEAAAPLQCGGATVFNALYSYGIKPTDTVGVMGVGGLGHLAIQFASKMGCTVVVLSGSDRKKDEAMKLGATEFVATKGVKELKVSHPIDRLLITTSAQPDWQQLLPVLAPQGSIHPLSVASGNLEAPYFPIVANGLTIQGSVVASRHVHRKMLEFAALHNIEPIVETFPMTEKGIEDAMQKLTDGSIRYRAVLIPE
ncbi:hypothetical protein LTR37_019985 [Vermiconidia calcicola]|uniref:Uncharacterized protein n=1 Tax=Vermiconidia calcicola TaxID=1690605 RepID=A0ACC3MEF3_9PEZI|nr:hypothetical protein LTR37_019985 [Vermiconidia calcicola]